MGDNAQGMFAWGAGLWRRDRGEHRYHTGKAESSSVSSHCLARVLGAYGGTPIYDVTSRVHLRLRKPTSEPITFLPAICLTKQRTRRSLRGIWTAPGYWTRMAAGGGT